MRCDQVRAILEEYIDGSAPPESKADAARHLEGCDSCANGRCNEHQELVVMTRAEHTRLHSLERWNDPEMRAYIIKRMREAAKRRRLSN